MIKIHAGPAACCNQDRLCCDISKTTAAHIDHQYASQTTTIFGLDQLHGTVILQPPNIPCPYLFGQSVNDLYASEIALVYRPVEGLTGKCFLMHGAVWISVEKATIFILQLADTLLSASH